MEFLLTLYDILEGCCPHESPMYWLSDGESFEISDRGKFCAEVLKISFEDMTFETFSSRLVSLKFKKNIDSDRVSFSHLLFSRENRSLISLIFDPTISADLENGVSKKQGSAFLEKLFDILESGAYDDYISWCDDDGTSVLVKRVEEFSQIVLPKYYKHNNFQSFVRQLNMYSFNKTSHDANWREFKQPLFRKGKRNLLPLISRKTQQKFLPTPNSTPHDSSRYRSSCGGSSMSNGVSLDSRRAQSADGFGMTPVNIISPAPPLACRLPSGPAGADNSSVNIQRRVIDLEERVCRLESLLFQAMAQQSPSQQNIRDRNVMHTKDQSESKTHRNSYSVISSGRQCQLQLYRDASNLPGSVSSSDGTISRSNSSDISTHSNLRKAASVPSIASVSEQRETVIGMEGVGLQRNRSVGSETAYHSPRSLADVIVSTSVSSRPSVKGETMVIGTSSGLDAILNAAAVLPCRSPHVAPSSDRCAPDCCDDGRPLKKLRTVDHTMDIALMRDNDDEHRAESRPESDDARS